MGASTTFEDGRKVREGRWGVVLIMLVALFGVTKALDSGAAASKAEAAIWNFIFLWIVCVAIVVDDADYKRVLEVWYRGF